ncbi:MAG TPA: hypothetical protein PLJ60_10015 [Chryseolinea sp.]|nr:hypothetical protein [Chryseolinea sp.]HPM30658.1 hypothetical protein [Chryseolinea sp.]
MKKSVAYLLFLITILTTGFRSDQGENVEFSCMKTLKSTNTCHFNFFVDGAKYRYVDIGCKFSKKRDDVIKKAKEGSLALSKDWKIECPEVKEKKDGDL